MEKRKPIKTNPRLVKLWASLDAAQRKVFAKHVKSTVNSFKHTAYGRRRITPETAVRIEKATVRMGLDVIGRTELNETCARCEFARACLKGKLT